MITVERAAELVNKLEDIDKVDLFCHFVEVLDVQGKEAIEFFASLCGFGIAKNARIVEEE